MMHHQDDDDVVKGHLSADDLLAGGSLSLFSRSYMCLVYVCICVGRGKKCVPSASS